MNHLTHDDGEDADEEVDEDANEDIDDAFDPLAIPGGGFGSNQKRTLSDEEGEARVVSKRHRFGHYPAARFDTDQEFLFFQ